VLSQPFAAATGPPYSVTALGAFLDFPHPTSHGRRRHARGPSDHADPPTTPRPGLHTQQHPLLPLVQQRQHHRELPRQRLLGDLHTRRLTHPTHQKRYLCPTPKHALLIAEKQVVAACEPRSIEAGTHQYGTDFPLAAALATILAPKVRRRFALAALEAALRLDDVSANRQEAVFAIKTIAGYLNEADRDELFEAVIPIAQGAHDQGYDDEWFADMAVPLSRFRVNLAVSSLRPAAIRALACLAYRSEQFEQIQELAVELLNGADDQTCYHIAHALSRVPPSELRLDLTLLGTHPSKWLRALAAVAWNADPARAPGLGERLAQDASPQVRRSLASTLHDRKDVAELRRTLSTDIRRSVRLAATNHRG